MPNWCTTNILINGPEKEVDVLYEKLKEIRRKATIKTDFGCGWLGHILDHLGFSEDEILHGKMRCRGEISFMQRNGDEISLETTTAWAPMLGPIDLLMQNYAPESSLTSTADEFGCCLHYSNDPVVEGKYVIDMWDPHDLPEALVIAGQSLDPISERDLTEVLKEALCQDAGFDELMSEAIEKWDDNLSFVKYEHCDASEFC